MDRRAFLVRSAGAGLALTVVRDADARVDPRLRALARDLRGPVYLPGTAGWEAGRRAFNARFHATPLAVAQPLDARDVAVAVRWARKHGVRPIARSGGHSYAGYSTGAGLVVDLSRLRGVAVHPGTRTVAIGPGARLIDVYAELAQHSAGIPAGSCPTVGFGGHVLGGGVGLSSRLWGTASDNVEALTIVTADGRVRHCTARQNADLFWACRGGGGGNFGIATGSTLRAHATPRVSWFTLSFARDTAAAGLRAWTDWAPHAPDGLFSLFALAAGGTAQAFGQHFGSAAELTRLVAPLVRAGGATLRTGESTWWEAQLRWASCRGDLARCHAFSPTSFAAKSDYALGPWSAAAAEIAASHLADAAGLRVSLLLDSYGGALSRPRPDATAFVHRHVDFSLQQLAYWDAGDGAAERAWLARLHAALRPHVTGAAYVNYIDPELTGWERAYYGSNLARLRATKRAVDPENVFRFHQSIR